MSRNPLNRVRDIAIVKVNSLKVPKIAWINGLAMIIL